MKHNTDRTEHRRPARAAEVSAEQLGVPRRRRSRSRAILVLLLSLAALCWAAPSIVAHTSLRHRIWGWIYPEFVGRVTVGRAELGWGSIVTLHDVTILDSAGRQLLVADKLQTSRSLRELLMQPNDWGQWQFHQPTLHVATRPGGSNFEDAWTVLFGGDGEPSDEPTKFRITVDQGTVQLSDATTGVRGQLRDVRADVDVRDDGVHITAAARTAMDGQTGTVTVAGTWMTAVSSEQTKSAPPVIVHARHLPLGILEPLLTRFHISGQIHGQSDLECSLTYDESVAPWSIQISATARGHDWQIRIPQITGNEALEFPLVELELASHCTPEWLRLETGRLTADTIQLHARGSVPLPPMAAGNWAFLWHDPNPELAAEVEGQVDAAGLARMLPRLFQLRPDTSIDRGTAKFHVSSQLVQGRRELSINVQTDQLVARCADQTIRWTEPVALQAVVSTEGGVTTVNHVQASSDFFSIEGSGHASSGSITLSADLSRLATQLTQLIECNIQSMAGRANGRLEWGSTAEHFRHLRGEVMVDELMLTTADGRTWTEPQLQIQGHAEGMFEDGRLVRADQLTVDLKVREDTAAVRLSTPTMINTQPFRLPLDVSLAGDLSGWLARLAPWVPLGDLRGAGAVQATAEVEIGADEIWVSKSRVDLTDVECQGWGMALSEPMARLEAQVRWDRATSMVSIPQITMTSTSLAARGADFVVQPAAEIGWRLDGDIAARGDLLAVTQWFSQAESAAHRVRGEFELRADIRSENASLLVDGNLTAKPFTYERLNAPSAVPVAGSAPGTLEKWKPIWNDQQVQLLASVAYDWQDDAARLDELHVVSQGLRASATGTVTDMHKSPVADIRGEIDYDLQTIISKLYNFVGPGILFRGRGTQPFQIQGPLSTKSIQLGGTVGAALSGLVSQHTRVSPQLTGQASLGWDVAKIHGVTLDATQVTGKLHDGVVDVTPLSLNMGNQGRLSLAPRVDLNGPQPSVVLGPGRIAENVQITPELCRSWLRYVAPVLSSATAVDGRFSVDLSGATLPLGDLAATECSGSIAIDQARLKPGPMADQIVAIVDQLSRLTGGRGNRLGFLQSDQTWLEVGQQTVNFQMMDGRVHHDSLEVRVDDLVIRTTGWVGLDQSMSLIAEIPVLDEWVANERWLAGMQGQMLRIPVQGTLTQPQLDPSIVGQISRQMLGGGARELLREELRKGLQDGVQLLLEGR